MSSPATVEDLRDDEWAQLEARLKDYSQASQTAATVALDRFLPPPGDRLRPVFLREFIKKDLEFRWKKGQPTCLEVYLQDYPELREEPGGLPDLLFEEYRVRHQHGDRPDLAVYESRFPEHFTALRRRVGQRPPTLNEGTPTLPQSAAPVGSERTALRVGGGYQLLKRIGSGAFGEVWKAEAPGGVPVAVKIILRPLDHADARQELEALELIKGLHHLFLLQTHSFWPQEDRLVIVMDLADGSLRHRLKECKAAGLPGIPLDELLRYFNEAAEALDYLHEKNVLHRDIKPDNILLLGRHARLADFGLARLGATQRSLTTTGSGTPPYMAPEVWRNRFTPASDQYSLAASYAEIRLQRRLFNARDMVEVMLQHLEQMPDLNPLSPAEQEVLRKALAKKPEERYPSCLAFWQALYLATEPERTASTGSMPVTPVPPGARPHTPASTLNLGTPRESLPIAPTAVSLGMDHRPATASEPEPLVATLLPPEVVPTDGQRARPVARPPTSSPTAPVVSWKADRPPASSLPRWAWAVAVLVGLCVVAAVVWRARQPSVGSGDQSPSSPAPAGYLAEHWRTPDAEPVLVDGHYYYKTIFDRLPDGTEVEFLLMPHNADRPDSPPTFYIMRDKVSNGLFRRFAEALPEAVKGSQWKRGGVIGNDDKERDLGVADEKFPVFNVTALEAHEFARWLGGELPTLQQWDKAGGYYEDRRGPYTKNPKLLEPGDIGLSVSGVNTGPLEVGAARLDRVPSGCRDLAGNGKEWTRTLGGFGNEHKVLERFPPARPNLRLRIRGQSYRAGTPINFEDDNDSQPWSQPKPDLGFRVVIDLPDAAPNDK